MFPMRVVELVVDDDSKTRIRELMVFIIIDTVCGVIYQNRPSDQRVSYIACLEWGDSEEINFTDCASLLVATTCPDLHNFPFRGRSASMRLKDICGKAR
jgi:hypothetical protein